MSGAVDIVGIPASKLARITSFIRRAMITVDADTVALVALGTRGEEMRLAAFALAKDTEPEDVARDIAVSIEEDQENSARHRLESFRGDVKLAPQLVLSVPGSRGRQAHARVEESKEKWIADMARSHDAMSKTVALVAATQAESFRGIVETLGKRAEAAERSVTDALTMYIDARRADALNAAEARRLDAETHAIEKTAGVLVDAIPEAIAGAKAHFAAKHAEENPIFKVASEFMADLPPEHIEVIASVLPPKQKARFVALWEALVKPMSGPPPGKGANGGARHGS